jgi:hypothetical protein
MNEERWISKHLATFGKSEQVSPRDKGRPIDAEISLHDYSEKLPLFEPIWNEDAVLDKANIANTMQPNFAEDIVKFSGLPSLHFGYCFTVLEFLYPETSNDGAM